MVIFLAAKSSQAAVRGKSLANSSVVALSFWKAAYYSHGLSFNRSWSWFSEPRVYNTMLPTIKTEVVSSRDSVFKVIQCHFPIAERSSKVTKLLREAAALSSALGVRQVKELKKGSEAQCGGLACSCSAGREGEGFSEGITGLGVG